MKIALINENSQAAKNEMIYKLLKNVAEAKGHTVYNYGMYGADDPNSINYVMCGVLAGILINSKAADYVITGCGSGVGAMIAANAFPNVQCGHVSHVEDAVLFSQVNDGNVVALPLGKDFGFAAELRLQYIFEKLFEKESGGGYPPARKDAQQQSKKMLDAIKQISHKDMLTILKEMDQDVLKTTISGEHFGELFFANCEDAEIAEYLKTILD